MTGPSHPTAHENPQDRRLRQTWWFLGGSLIVVGVAVALRLGGNEARTTDVVLAGLVVILGCATILHRNAVHALEVGRRAEAESFARILQGLSRSVSPDAIVDAIVGDLVHGSGADHVVVIRRRAGSKALDATLVSRTPGVPNSTTLVPASDLDDVPIRRQSDEARELVAVGPGPASGELALAAAPSRAGRSLASVAGWASPLRMPVRLPRAGARAIADRLAARAGTAFGLKHTLAAPLVAHGDVVGAIVLSRRTPGSWPASSQRLLAVSAVEASAALTRALSHRAAEARASTDVLTGLPNRRYFEEFCGLIAQRRRADDALGVLMIDVDRFKSVNDAHGHVVGDEVLRAVGGAIAAAIREHDVPARYGGEEFAVLLRNPSRSDAIEVGERVRLAVGRLDLERFGVAGVSVSIGVAVTEAVDEPVRDLVDRADTALYRAKRMGRDRVVAG